MGHALHRLIPVLALTAVMAGCSDGQRVVLPSSLPETPSPATGREVTVLVERSRCDSAIRPNVSENEETVTIEVTAERAGGACQSQALVEPLVVRLKEPLGDRSVVAEDAPSASG